MNTRKKSSALRSKLSLSRGPESYAFILGLLAGLVPALLFILVFIFARIGPRGFLWWEGKGGETIPTPLARIIAIAIFAVGAFGGAICAFVLEVRWRPETLAARPKSEAQREHLWDRELDE